MNRNQDPESPGSYWQRNSTCGSSVPFSKFDFHNITSRNRPVAVTLVTSKSPFVHCVAMIRCHLFMEIHLNFCTYSWYPCFSWGNYNCLLKCQVIKCYAIKCHVIPYMIIILHDVSWYHVLRLCNFVISCGVSWCRVLWSDIWDNFMSNEHHKTAKCHVFWRCCDGKWCHKMSCNEM